MRALTDSESRIMAVLLAARPDRERERLRQIGVPRSTYHAVRRRAYEEGWLRDRYIPHPVPIGRPYVTFLLARPYADRFDEFGSRIADDPSDVVLWSGTQIALGVLFHGRPTDGRRLADKIESSRLATNPLALTVDVHGPTVPVYFDFEGLWCHLAGLAGTLAYPHGLGGVLPGASEDDDGVSELSPHQRWAVGELLRRPFIALEQGRGAHLVGPVGLPYSQRRTMTRGWIAHRTLLDPSRVPPYQGRSPDQVVFLSGTPRKEARPEILFATLTRECRVFPFLFVVGADRWLLGALGGSAATPDPSSRRPVLPTLREFLEGIEIIQEAASTFNALVDHRYDRMLANGASIGPSKP